MRRTISWELWQSAAEAEGIEVCCHVFRRPETFCSWRIPHIEIRYPQDQPRQHTSIYDYYPEDVKRAIPGNTATEFIDVKALMGDASDNIPGVPSIGEKTATNLIVTYGSIENAYAHVDEIKPPRAQKALCWSITTWPR